VFDFDLSSDDKSDSLKEVLKIRLTAGYVWLTPVILAT
jgi:hypothetical protein